MRIAAGLSQKELAQRSGMSVRGLRYLEQGDQVRPQAVSLSRLAAVLGLAPQELADRFSGEPSPQRLSAPSGTQTERARAVVRVAVLGPLVVSFGGTAVPVTSTKQRLLLGLLALQPGTPVGPDEIIDLLWGERPPRTCRQLVHTYVGQVRRLLEPVGPAPRAGAPASRLRLCGTGYRLDLGPDELDLAEFDSLAEQGRTARAAGAAPSARQFFREAWALWRAPLPAGEGRLEGHPAAVAVRRRRTALLLEWADTAMVVARYEEVIGPLREERAEEPLHEGLAARLILALAGDGQQAAALELYERLRRRLDAELGVAPGPELRAAQLRVLRGQLPPVTRVAGGPPATPAQLPAESDSFTGRSRELAALEEQLSGASGATGARIALLTGMAGAGKTALAVHWAHRVRRLFPDGQLFVDLRGHSREEPLAPLAALAGFLRALGETADPGTDEDQSAALYRSRLAGKRVLVVLDNASSPEQVRPLLPAGEGPFVVVTSRHRLTGLVAREGARSVPLEPLDAAESVALLERMLGSPRAVAQRAAVAETARLCAHLPLALRIAAANLVALPHHRVADYNAELLAGNRLDALDADGDSATAVRGTFELSCRTLTPAELLMFSRVGMAPGPDVSTGAAAVLAETTPAAARHTLRRLTAQHLVHEPVPDRWAMHDLVRLYATELASAPDGTYPAAGVAALDRLVGYDLDRLAAAARLLYPHLLHLPTHRWPSGPETDGPFQDSGAALAWLDVERAGLVALAHRMGELGRHHAVRHIADLLSGYFLLRGNGVDWRPLAEAAHAAAEAEGDLTARAGAELQMGMVELQQGRHERAAGHQRAAVLLAEQAGWTPCRAVALNNLSASLWAGGEEVDGVILGLEEALVLHRAAGRVAGEAVTLANLGAAHADRGKEPVLGERERTSLRLAMLYLDRALVLHRGIGDRRNEASTLRVLAEARRDAGDLAGAAESASRALELARDTDDTKFQAEALSVLGTVHARAGDPDRALAAHARASRLAHSTDDPRLSAETSLALADTCVRLGRADEARLHLDDARHLARALGSGLLKRQCDRIASRLPALLS